MRFTLKIKHFLHVAGQSGVLGYTLTSSHRDKSKYYKISELKPQKPPIQYFESLLLGIFFHRPCSPKTHKCNIHSSDKPSSKFNWTVHQNSKLCLVEISNGFVKLPSDVGLKICLYVPSEMQPGFRTGVTHSSTVIARASPSLPSSTKFSCFSRCQSDNIQNSPTLILC